MHDGARRSNIYDRRDRFLRLVRPAPLWVPLLICVCGGVALKFGVSPHQFEGTETLANQRQFLKAPNWTHARLAGNCTLASDWQL